MDGECAQKNVVEYYCNANANHKMLSTGEQRKCMPLFIPSFIPLHTKWQISQIVSKEIKHATCWYWTNIRPCVL